MFLKYTIYLLIFIGLVMSINMFVRNILLITPDFSGQFPPVSGIQVKHSDKIGGRGLFATKMFMKNDIVEVCPIIIDERKNFKGKMLDYIFEKHDEKTKSMFPVGYMVMLNHSDDPNVWMKRYGEDYIIVRTNKTIVPGEELFIDYGKKYCDGRDNVEKID